MRLYQNGDLQYLKQSMLTIEGWVPSLTAGAITGHRDSTVSISWALSDTNGVFVGNVSIYVLRGFTWQLIVGNVSTTFSYFLNLPEGDYQCRIDFLGDAIRVPATVYTAIHVLPPELSLLGRFWPWLVAIGGVIGGAYALNRYVWRRQAKVAPQQKVKSLQRSLKDQPRPVLNTKDEGLSPKPEVVEPTKVREGEKSSKKRRVRDYHVEPEPDVLEK